MTTEATSARERETVLVALDGSAAAATALPLARAVAAQLGARLAILHAVPAPEPGAAIRQRIGADRGPLAALALDAPVAEAASAIVARADDPGVAVVVLTTHGREVVPERALGGVAAAVVARANVPILLVRPGTARSDPGPLRLLLAPLDGTPTTAGALAPAAALAARLGAAVDLLYIAGPGTPRAAERGTLGPPRYVDQSHHEWPQWATEAAAHLRASCAGWPAGVPLRAFFAAGEIGPAIARFAADGYDAVILVRRSRFEPGRAPVLRAVLDRTPCPILLVGAPADAVPVPGEEGPGKQADQTGRGASPPR